MTRGIPCGRQARFGSLTLVSAFLNRSSAQGVNGGVVSLGKRAGWNLSIIHTPVRSGVPPAGADTVPGANSADETKISAAADGKNAFKRFCTMKLLGGSRARGLTGQLLRVPARSKRRFSR